MAKLKYQARQGMGKGDRSHGNEVQYMCSQQEQKTRNRRKEVNTIIASCASRQLSLSSSLCNDLMLLKL
eukprot:1721150-Amphidinium_carterae.1